MMNLFLAILVDNFDEARNNIEKEQALKKIQERKNQAQK